MSPNRLIAIGDVHGCFHALDAVLTEIEPTSDDRIVFLGDMVDTGKETREVLERIITLKQECDVVMIQGNHEEMMYAARENEKALRYWENCGGVQTLNSYRFGGTLAEVPAAHWALLDTCVPYYETDEFILTHANYVPDLPMAEQPEYSLRWELFDRDQAAAPLFRQDRRGGPHRAEERGDSRPGLRDMHRHGVLQVRLVDGDRHVHARNLASKPLGNVARMLTRQVIATNSKSC